MAFPKGVETAAVLFRRPLVEIRAERARGAPLEREPLAFLL